MQRIMDSAEQAALSESEHDGGAIGSNVPQSLLKRHYESTVYQPAHYERYVSGGIEDFDELSDASGGSKHQRDVSDAAEQRAMRRFDREPVDLGRSGILVPEGVDTTGN